MEIDERQKYEERLARAYDLVDEANRQHFRSLHQIFVAQHIALFLFVAILLISR